MQATLGRVWRAAIPAVIPWKKYNKKFEFSVVSYNILSQLLLENNKYLYKNINSEYLNPVRFSRIIKELEILDADIVCLQEFDHQIRDIFSAHFAPLGFENIFERKPHLAYQEKDDGCFMMYRTNKLKLIKNESIGLFVNSEPYLDKPNCAQVALFETVDGSRLCVANTHLLYNPRRGDIKLAQISRILNQIQQLVNPSEQCGGVPVVFCGDFNTCPYAPLYQLMTLQRLQYSEWTPDKISGQKGGRGKHPIPPGLWDAARLGYHEHGLYARSAEYINTCRETRRSILQGSPVIQEGYKEASRCYKCGTLYPYKQGSISHNINFRSAYDHVDSDGRTKEVTTYIQHDARTVDYIWYSNHDTSPQNCPHGHTCDPDCREPVLVLNSRKRLLTKPELSNMGRLPNVELGSDHLALQAKFTMYSDPVPNSHSFGREGNGRAPVVPVYNIEPY